MKIQSFQNDNIGFDKIEKCLEIFETALDGCNSRSHYLISYEFILSFAKEVKFFDERTFTQLTSMIYSWMPRVLRIDYGEVKETIEILNKVKIRRIKILREEQFHRIKSVVNNSMVGTSKLLHFIDPDKYPIWDSKVASHFLGGKSPYQIGKVNNYIHYVKICKNAIRNPMFEKSYKKVKNVLENAELFHDISKMRAIELMLFYSS